MFLSDKYVNAKYVNVKYEFNFAMLCNLNLFLSKYFS